MKKRHTNHGLRKVCGCGRRSWPKCAHPWHFNFKMPGENGAVYRFSLDKHLQRHIDSKTEAEKEAEKIRTAIRDGVFRPRGSAEPTTPLDQLTLTQFFEHYRKRYLVPKGGALRNDDSQIAAICRTDVTRPDATVQPFGQWLVREITADAVEQFHEKRREGTLLPGKKAQHKPRKVGGAVAANRNLTFLRAAFNWGVEKGLVDAVRFKVSRRKGTLTQEFPRDRRLLPDEAERLLNACGSHLRALVEAALETGCRKGELLSLQWSQVRFAPRAELVLPPQKTKTRKGRTIPISTRLKAILEMRQQDPAGEDHPPTAFVFGTEIGTKATSIKTAWTLAMRRSGLIDLHFHDLRREAGSRWLEGGVPLHTVKTWLGHTNIAQTSTYLAGTFATEHDAMRAFEKRRGTLTEPVLVGEFDEQRDTSTHSA